MVRWIGCSSLNQMSRFWALYIKTSLVGSTSKLVRIQCRYRTTGERKKNYNFKVNRRLSNQNFKGETKWINIPEKFVIRWIIYTSKLLKKTKDKNIPSGFKAQSEFINAKITLKSRFWNHNGTLTWLFCSFTWVGVGVTHLKCINKTIYKYF